LKDPIANTTAAPTIPPTPASPVNEPSDDGGNLSDSSSVYEIFEDNINKEPSAPVTGSSDKLAKEDVVQVGYASDDDLSNLTWWKQNQSNLHWSSDYKYCLIGLDEDEVRN
jgi:hypothetical protein